MTFDPNTPRARAWIADHLTRLRDETRDWPMWMKRRMQPPTRVRVANDWGRYVPIREVESVVSHRRARVDARAGIVTLCGERLTDTVWYFASATRGTVNEPTTPCEACEARYDEDGRPAVSSRVPERELPRWARRS